MPQVKICYMAIPACPMGFKPFREKPFVPDMKPCFMEAPFLVNVRKLFCNLNVEKEGVNSNYEQSLNIKKCKKI